MKKNNTSESPLTVRVNKIHVFKKGILNDSLENQPEYFKYAKKDYVFLKLFTLIKYILNNKPELK